MDIKVNYQSGVAVYRQIMEQIKTLAAVGTLRAGDQLPSIRELAEQLRINRNTIAKVYSLLEQEGVVELHRGKGVFLTNRKNPYKAKVRNEILDDAIDAAIVQAWHFQIDQATFMERVKKRWQALEDEQDSQSRKGEDG